MLKLMRRVSVVSLAALLAALAGKLRATAKPEEPKLKLALIPVLDTIPIFIAQQNGYFAEQGITVETIPVRGRRKRDVLVTTGQVDGVLTHLQSARPAEQGRAQAQGGLHVSRPSLPERCRSFASWPALKTDHQRARRLEGRAGRHQREHGHGVSDHRDTGSGLKPQEIARVE